MYLDRASGFPSRIATGRESWPSGLVAQFGLPFDIQSRPKSRRHRYRDSNPGFRTENPIREGSFGRFGRVSGGLVRWSAVELAGVGDNFGTKFPRYAGPEGTGPLLRQLLLAFETRDES